MKESKSPKIRGKQPRKCTAQRLDTLVPEFNLQNICMLVESSSTTKWILLCDVILLKDTLPTCTHYTSHAW